MPTLIFGHLLTSSNYDDNEKKVVGGRNGFGAKLCNIFSNRFKVETSYKEYSKSFSQVWTDNMKNAKEAKISKNSSEDFTRISFSPDLSKFKMDKLDNDIVALFSRRAYDVAGSSKGVKVYLNGKRLMVNGFKEYVELFVKDKEDEVGNPIKVAYEAVNDRWEIAATVSDRGFQQNSFVNSIATTRGGKHVDYVTDQIVGKLADIIKKKNKAGISVKPFQIRNHLWVFVNCLIENPTFDSQTKETMTLQSKSFGSKCVPNEKFFNTVVKVGVVEAILSWVKFKAQSELSKKCHAKKHAKLTGIPKLEDANDAGTKNSIDCTLILTEGDSAKSLVVAGLGVVGRDKYGVFPLRGKMLNVREASHKQIIENAEINNIIKIVGLQYKKTYQSVEDLKSLRYGKLMIMTDQDQDGSHIKGLLINFIHHNWPSLLKLNFLEEFITPIVKASKGNDVHSFYSLPEFEEWKKEVHNWRTYKIKYYKGKSFFSTRHCLTTFFPQYIGLGTSTSAEAKEYFSDMNRHRIRFVYTGSEDDHFVQLAFSKKCVEQRKDWLTNSMDERKRRRELGLSEMFLYEKNTRQVSYKDFVNKELILFSNMDNERSIPSLVDGLKPGQRKVLFTCFKRNDKREVKVAQLAGSVGEHSAYHHGEVSLMSTIINLAQDFVGSNNINLLMPIGQFGTRLQGGKDAASARYIFTMLSPLARKLFSQLDEPLLNYLYDDNLKIEPEYYVPIIPMVLVNGAEGIGTGWSTKIPNYNPRDIVDNIRRMMRGEEVKVMKPWFKGFTGSIEQLDAQRFVVNGEAAILSSKSFEITELPIRVWTQTYKESVLETFLNGTEKMPSFITDYKEYHTDATVKFTVTMSEDNLRKTLDGGLHKTFKIQSTLSTTSMVLFDANGVLRRYETPEDILREFFPLRLEHYSKRKKYYEGILDAETLKLENQARFILEKNDRILVMENIRKKEFIAQLIKRNYDTDPVKVWKKRYAEKDDDVQSSSDSDSDDGHDKKYDFDYLIDMSMRSMLREKVDELTKLRDQKKAELTKLRASSPEDLWEEDLRAFLEELKTLEKQERELLLNGDAKTAKMSKTASRTIKAAKMVITEDHKPSPDGERVIPKIDNELLKKAGQLVKPKQQQQESSKAAEKMEQETEEQERKEARPVKPSTADDDSSDSSDGYVPLEKRIGKSPQLIDKKFSLITKTLDRAADNEAASKPPAEPEEKKKKPAPKKRAPKAKDTNGDHVPKKGAAGKGKKKGRNPWSESDESDGEQSEQELDFTDSSEEEVMPVRKKNGIAADKKNGENGQVAEKVAAAAAAAPETAPARTKFDSDDDLFASKPEPEKKKKTSEELFDSIFTPTGPSSTTSSKDNSERQEAIDKLLSREPMFNDSSDDSFDQPKPSSPKVTASKPAAKPKAKKKPPKKASSDDDASDSDDFKPTKAAAKKPAAKSRKKKKSSDSEEEKPSKKVIFLSAACQQ